MCTSIPIYFTLSITGCSFLERFERTLKTLLQKRGALFIMCEVLVKGNSGNPTNVCHEHERRKR